MIIVAHPDTQHSFQAALALRRAGLLRYLFTAVSLRRAGPVGPLLARFAPGVHARLAQHRSHAALDRAEVRTFPVHLIATRCGSRADAWSRRWFSRIAGRMGKAERCGVLCFNGNAADAFEILSGVGLPRLLDQTIAHPRWSKRVAVEEAERFPEFNDTWHRDVSWTERDARELELADLVICGSRFCAETMAQEDTPRSKLRIAEYGVDTERFTPRTTPRSPGPVRLLFVGALTLRKGLPYLLEAVSRVKGLGVTLTLAGTPCVDLGALSPYRGFVRHVPHVLHERIPELIREHDVYVFPSLVEGSSLSIYEALASGLPVITTPNSGSVVRDGVEGLIVPPRDVDALSGAIETLVRDPDRLQEMARAARLTALGRCTWTHYGERLVAAMGSLAGDRVCDPSRVENPA